MLPVRIRLETPKNISHTYVMLIAPEHPRLLRPSLTASVTGQNAHGGPLHGYCRICQTSAASSAEPGDGLLQRIAPRDAALASDCHKLTLLIPA